MKYTVIFKDYDGKILSKTEYNYGESVEKPENPQRVSDNTYAYKFVGWNNEVNNVTSNITYTAVYEATYIDYTVTFVNDDNKVISSKTYHYGDSVIEPEAPIKASDNEFNYTFLGWDKEVTTVTGDVTYKATYSTSLRKYTITYNTNGGNLIESELLEYNALITAKPKLDEKSFIGWFDESLTIEYTRVPACDVTLYAKWVDYEVTLTYKLITQIKETEVISKSLFEAYATDTDGNSVDVKITFTGNKISGETINVKFVAIGLYDIYDTYTIKNIKVYGDPKITYDENKDYINLSDTINPSLFNVSSVDSFNESLSASVNVKEENYKSGDLVTIVISSKDVVGNVTMYEISNIKVYGDPIITRDSTILSIRQSDNISNELFNVTAIDSFGQTILVTTEIYSGVQSAGTIITIKSLATDSKGNINSIIYKIKVYGLPTISDATINKFRVNDDITIDSLGISARDSFDEIIPDIQLKLQTGEQIAGQCLTYLVTATDFLGNVNTKKISNIKIYGNPEITYNTSKNAINITDTISANLFNAKATDTFGDSLNVSISLNSGSFVGGSIVTYKLSAVDILGNMCNVITNSIKVYSCDDILLNYTKSSSKIKATSHGEEFNASATNSFGDIIDTKIVADTGYQISGGNVVNLYIIAIDILGNTKKSELITNIKVYENIHISYEYETNYIHKNDDVETLFTIKDDFNKSLLPTFDIVSGNLSSDSITYKLTVKDSVGNFIDKNYTFDVLDELESILYMYENDALISTKRVNKNDSFSLDQLHNLHTIWYLNDSQITDDSGVSIDNWNSDSGIYNVYAYYNYSIIITYLNTYNNDTTSYTKSYYKCSYNQEFDLIYEKNTGYKLIGWYIDDVLITDDVTYTFNLTSNSVDIICKYTPKLYTVTIDATGYTYTGKTSYIVYYGESYTFDIISENLRTNQFKGWGYNNKQVTLNNGYIESWNIDSDVTLTPLVLFYSYTDSNKTSLYFGSYPQTKVSSASTISALNTTAGTLPTSSNTYKWTDYGYYKSGYVSSYMYYIDIDQDNDGNNDYRGVYFTQYRPYIITTSSSNNYQSINGYSTNTVYWFKYEPIKWDILKTENNKALIISNLILDSQDYYYTRDLRTNVSDYQGNKSSGIVYANNYMYSHIRSWLNTTFYKTAFSSLEKEIIETTLVDNSGSSTGSSSIFFECSNTNDKIFLLSYKEVTTYYSSNTNMAKMAKGSDYAKSQGLYVSTSSNYNSSRYWLRSPCNYDSLSNCYAVSVDCDGAIGDGFGNYVFYTEQGVRAACWINI